ncbi:MAG: phospholipase D-like domain-containing protein [Chloroflexota bacterium]
MTNSQDIKEESKTQRLRSTIALALVISPILGIVLIYLSGISQQWVNPDKPKVTRPVHVISADWYDLYFTRIDAESTWKDGIDQQLANDISNAQSSIDVAAYSLDISILIDALVDAHERGLQVKLIIEADNSTSDQLSRLPDAGILVVTDDRSGTMHNKFVVIDQAIVWTGSWNMTYMGTYRNYNHAIRIQSVRLAENYVAEFNEMYEEGQFGKTSTKGVPHPTLALDGSNVETLFSPEDRIMDRIIDLVENAKQSIHFMAMSFTHDDLGQAMIQRFKDGLKVEGVFESHGAGAQASEYTKLKQAGVPVWRETSDARMHNKVLVVDQSIVMLGSFNLSQSADQYNDENVLIIHDRELAQHFIDEMNLIVATSHP